MIPHARFPYDQSPWINHAHDADEANEQSRVARAVSADESGNDALAAHIMGASPGENPYLSFDGPFFEGHHGQQVTPDLPNHLLEQYFGPEVAYGSSLDLKAHKERVAKLAKPGPGYLPKQGQNVLFGLPFVDSPDGLVPVKPPSGSR